MQVIPGEPVVTSFTPVSVALETSQEIQDAKAFLNAVASLAPTGGPRILALAIRDALNLIV